jgi:hypothetical protein
MKRTTPAIIKCALVTVAALAVLKNSHGFVVKGPSSSLNRSTAASRLGMVTNIPRTLDATTDVPGDPKRTIDSSSAAKKESQPQQSKDIPPQLKMVQESFAKLKSGSDIRGSFVNHGEISVPSAAPALARVPAEGAPASITPIAAFCMGYAFAKMVAASETNNETPPTICIGRDPRSHGSRYVMAKAFAGL